MKEFCLRFSSQGVAATTGVNGAPLGVESTGKGVSLNLTVNYWLRPGRNFLNVLIVPAPPAPPDAGKRENFALAVVYLADPSNPTNENLHPLARFDRAEGDVLPLPVVREIPFEVTELPPCRLWADADVVEKLTPADESALKGLIRDFENAILARNLDRILQIIDYKTTDMALCIEHSPEPMRQILRQQYRDMMFAEPSLQIPARETPDLVMKLICQNQVVWISRHLTEAAIIVAAPESSYEIEVFAARIKGKWCIVR